MQDNLSAQEEIIEALTDEGPGEGVAVLISGVDHRGRVVTGCSGRGSYL